MSVNIRPNTQSQWYAPSRDLCRVLPHVLAKSLKDIGANDPFQATVAWAANKATMGENGSSYLLEHLSDADIQRLAVRFLINILDFYEQSVDSPVREEVKGRVDKLGQLK